MTSLDRTPVDTESPVPHTSPWVAAGTTLAILGTVLVLAFSGYTEVAVAVAATGLAGAIGVRISIHIRR